MQNRSFPLPIRSLVRPARLGHRQRLSAVVGAQVSAGVRFVQCNLVAARAARSVWLGGPLFTSSSLDSQGINQRQAA
jgi:hypothetical protein